MIVVIMQKKLFTQLDHDKRFKSPETKNDEKRRTAYSLLCVYNMCTIIN